MSYNEQKGSRVLPSEYTEEEHEKIIQSAMKLKGDILREFLEKYKLPRSGNKSVLRERIQKYIEEKQLNYADLVDLLDEFAPWGKQHVFLYNGPEGKEFEHYSNTEWVSEHLKRYKVDKYLNRRVPLILPVTLTLSSIESTPSRLRIIAVGRRDYSQRKKEYDRTDKTGDGDIIELRGYLKHISRGLVIFEWNLLSNTAMLQITELPGELKYEDVESQFVELVQKWLDIRHFRKLDLRRAISKLQELEEGGNGETRSHGIDYRTIGGRRLYGRSPTAKTSLLGETVIDNAMKTIRQKGVGRLGNFYWLPASQNLCHNNSLENEVHIVIIGEKSRIHFKAQNKEKDIHYVLYRLREHSK